MVKPFPERAWFRPLKTGGRYPRGKMPEMINGVYAIRRRTDKRVLYVGESHGQSLYKTLTRHLQYWVDGDRGPRETYHHEDVEIAWRPSRQPLEEEAALILFYRPLDNTKGLFDQLEALDLEGDGLPDSYEPEGADFPTVAAGAGDEVPF